MPEEYEELTFNMTRANISLIVKQELVKRFSEKNEVFSELYVPFSLKLFFFFFLFPPPLITVYDISLYVHALLLYISLSSVSSRTTQI